MKIQKLPLQRKLLILGVILTVIPLIIMCFVSSRQSKEIDVAAIDGIRDLATQDLEHIVSNIYNMNRIQQELIQLSVSKSINVARDKLLELGDLSLLEDKPIEWEVINQYTKASKKVSLPQFSFGDQVIAQRFEMDTEVPVVDSVQKLVGGTCTIFQRINEEGDMLRIATNVETLEKKRAIGTYIPAINPDGKHNPVVQTLLNGHTYRGKAFVVNDWYLTAYEPIYDEDKKVVGALYFGIRQEAGGELRNIIKNIQIGHSGYVFVINSKGEYVISDDGRRDGESILNSKDEKGNYFIKEIIKEAHDSREGETFEKSYPWVHKSQDVAQMKFTKLIYFEDWDWIIGAGAPEEQIYAAGNVIHNIAEEGLHFLFITLFVSLLFCVLSWGTLSKRISGNISTVSHELKIGSSHVNCAAEEIARSSQILADGASEQASSLEETCASIEEIGCRVKRNMEHAKEADKLASTCNSQIEEASSRMDELNDAMDQINKSSDETAKIMKTINEIAFQTNVLALNAAVEAARAGESGAGFSIVAEEVRGLALRSSDAAQTTASLVNANKEVIEKGNLLAEGAKKTFEDSRISVVQVSSLVNDIASASEENCENLEQINIALSNIDQVVQQTTARAEESANASLNMREQSGKMGEMVDDLSKLVDGEAYSEKQNSASSIEEFELAVV